MCGQCPPGESYACTGREWRRGQSGEGNMLYCSHKYVWKLGLGYQLEKISVYQISADILLIKHISSQLIWISAGPAPERIGDWVPVRHRLLFGGLRVSWKTHFGFSVQGLGLRILDEIAMCFIIARQTDRQPARQRERERRWLFGSCVAATACCLEVWGSRFRV